MKKRPSKRKPASESPADTLGLCTGRKEPRRPAYRIGVTRLCHCAFGNPHRLKEAVRAVLHRHDVETADIGVVLVDDEAIANLNDRFLRRRYATDVLAFDGRDATVPIKRQASTTVEGEIIVSVETAVREAEERGHGVEAELTLYTVHGLLHLLGYRDDQRRHAARMHRAEIQILNDLGIKGVHGISAAITPRGQRT